LGNVNYYGSKTIRKDEQEIAQKNKVDFMMNLSKIAQNKNRKQEKMSDTQTSKFETNTWLPNNL